MFLRVLVSSWLELSKQIPPDSKTRRNTKNLVPSNTKRTLATTKYSPRIPRIFTLPGIPLPAGNGSCGRARGLVAARRQYQPLQPRCSGVPSVTRSATGNQTPKNAFRRLSFSRLGATVEWEEEPFEWTRPQRFGVVRRYLKGPLAEMRVLVELTPQPSGGSRLVYQVWGPAQSVLRVMVIPLQIGIIRRAELRCHVSPV